jgi:hypothetical protein
VRAIEEGPHRLESLRPERRGRGVIEVNAR